MDLFIITNIKDFAMIKNKKRILFYIEFLRSIEKKIKIHLKIVNL